VAAVLAVALVLALAYPNLPSLQALTSTKPKDSAADLLREMRLANGEFERRLAVYSGGSAPAVCAGTPGERPPGDELA